MFYIILQRSTKSLLTAWPKYHHWGFELVYASVIFLYWNVYYFQILNVVTLKFVFGCGNIIQAANFDISGPNLCITPKWHLLVMRTLFCIYFCVCLCLWRLSAYKRLKSIWRFWCVDIKYIITIEKEVSIDSEFEPLWKLPYIRWKVIILSTLSMCAVI